MLCTASYLLECSLSDNAEKVVVTDAAASFANIAAAPAAAAPTLLILLPILLQSGAVNIQCEWFQSTTSRLAKAASNILSHKQTSHS